MNDIIISAEKIEKIYKLYRKPSDRLKESLHPLRKKYHKDFYALKNVSFQITKGDTVGIIGKNGSGKSTLLKIIAGVLIPNSGSLYVNGKIAAILELGAGFNPELTGIENIYFHGAILGFSKKEIDDLRESILSFADIGEFIDQPVKTYSSGMLARLAFSIAINVNPDILIIDEALSVGDAAFQNKCYNKFREFQDKKQTILFVTHSSDLIIKYCKYALLLDNGQPVYFGESKEAVERYKQLQVNTIPVQYSEKSHQNSADDTKNSLLTNSQFNPSAIIYGTNEAKITDFCLFNKHMEPSTQLFFDDFYTISMTLEFYADIADPIFAYSIKTIDGLDLLGSNNLFVDAPTGLIKKGEKVKVMFTQKMVLNGGTYLMSLGCTKFQNDNLTVFQRIYDAIVFNVVSPKSNFGITYVESDFKMEKLA